MAWAAGTDLRRAIANTDKRVVARWHSGWARLGIRGLAEVGLHGARRHLAVRRVVQIAEHTDDQRCHSGNVRRRHRGALKVAIHYGRLRHVASVLLDASGAG